MRRHDCWSLTRGGVQSLIKGKIRETGLGRGLLASGSVNNTGIDLSFISCHFFASLIKHDFLGLLSKFSYLD